METQTPLLHDFSGDHQLIGLDGDYRPVKSLKQWWAIFWIETFKLWEIGGPIAFNILCQFGIYSITVAFCGHLGAVELSAVSVAQNVIGTFSFGFMVRTTSSPLFSLLLLRENDINSLFMFGRPKIIL